LSAKTMSIKPQHATPSDWAWLEGNSTVDRCDAAWSRGLIELRARVEALEAGATCPHVVTSDEGTSYCRLADQTANSQSTPNHRQIRSSDVASSLVEKVALKIAHKGCFLPTDVYGDDARAARRPKPPSLKEQALTALMRYTTGETILTNESVDTIRRALEALDD
jgi:hypothetical protein